MNIDKFDGPVGFVGFDDPVSFDDPDDPDDPVSFVDQQMCINAHQPKNLLAMFKPAWLRRFLDVQPSKPSKPTLYKKTGCQSPKRSARNHKPHN